MIDLLALLHQIYARASYCRSQILSQSRQAVAGLT